MQDTGSLPEIVAILVTQARATASSSPKFAASGLEELLTKPMAPAWCEHLTAQIGGNLRIYRTTDLVEDDTIGFGFCTSRGLSQE